MNLLQAKPGEVEMVYMMDESQLLNLWSIICCFGAIREIKNPDTQSEILTNAQILLTAFILELQPLPGCGSKTIGPGGDQIAKFDA
jgi:hypothetical protein